MTEMKDSGIEWLGAIPSHWKICRLKNLAQIVTGNTPDKKYENQDNYSSQGMMWIKPNDLNELKYIEETQEYLSEQGKSLAKIVPANTPLVCCIGSIGKIGVANSIVAFNQQINGIVFNQKTFNVRYGLYVLISQESQHWFYANGNVLKILNAFNQGNIKIPLPPLDEQKKIADFLDKKCSAIDSALDAAKKLVEKLREYKKSLITETVTKGLNSSAEMQDSGIEWLGDIPSHWKIIKLKYLGNARNGLTYSPNDVVEKDEGILVLRSSNIQNGKLFFEDNVYLKNVGENFLVQKGDIIICSRNGSREILLILLIKISNFFNL